MAFSRKLHVLYLYLVKTLLVVVETVDRQLATTVGMVKAGMRLVPDAIYSALHCHHGLRLAGLGMIPSFMEAMVTLLVSYFVLGYPPIWAVCLGSVSTVCDFVKNMYLSEPDIGI